MFFNYKTISLRSRGVQLKFQIDKNSFDFVDRLNVFWLFCDKLVRGEALFSFIAQRIWPSLDNVKYVFEIISRKRQSWTSNK